MPDPMKRITRVKAYDLLPIYIKDTTCQRGVEIAYVLGNGDIGDHHLVFVIDGHYLIELAG